MRQNSSQKPVRRRLTIVTTSPLISNPRVVKETIALADAGYDVTVVRGPALASLQSQELALNAQLAERSKIISIDWNVEPSLKTKSAVIQRAFRALHKSTGMFASRAYTRLYGMYQNVLKKNDVDLLIAHNLTALPVTVAAANRLRKPVAFDAEDFHSGQFPEDEKQSYEYRLTCAIERRFIPKCAYLTAASSGIAAAYRSMLDVPMPVVLLNVFPLKRQSCD